LLSQDGYGWKNLLNDNTLGGLFTAFSVDNFKCIEPFSQVIDAGIAGGYIHELVHHSTGIVHHEDVQFT
jgi:hypothetical protein